MKVDSTSLERISGEEVVKSLYLFILHHCHFVTEPQKGFNLKVAAGGKKCPLYIPD